MQAIVNCKIILPQKILENHVILFETTIESIIPLENFAPATCERVFDAHGDYVSPGFINMHIHGCAGADVMDTEPSALQTMRKALISTGVTAFLPTTMTYNFPRIYQALDNIRNSMSKEIGARVLGCNLEGPYISQEFKGAQAPENILQADFSKIEKYADVIKIITVAPEKLPDEEFLQLCKKNKIIISLGHSGATYEEAMSAISKGATHVTHLFNAMTAFHHRNPGLAGAALDSNVNCELIVDNIHVHPAVQRLVYKVKGKSTIILVTDSMRACLQEDGISELGGQKVFVHNKIATLEDGTIAGSVLTMDRAIMNFLTNTGALLTDVIAMVTVNPAKELGLYKQLGSISPGKKADMVIFDNKINIKTTFIKGVQVFQK
jgi:N-acetylglucosamine-6-phosphate deacetylase